MAVDPLRFICQSNGHYALSQGQVTPVDQFLKDCREIDRQLRQTVTLHAAAQDHKRDDDNDDDISLERKGFPESIKLNEHGLFRLFEGSYSYLGVKAMTIFHIISAAAGDLADLIEDMLESDLDEPKAIVTNHASNSWKFNIRWRTSHYRPDERLVSMPEGTCCSDLPRRSSEQCSCIEK